MLWLGYVKICKVLLGILYYVIVRVGQVRLGFVRSSKARYNLFMSGNVRLGYFRVE